MMKLPNCLSGNLILLDLTVYCYSRLANILHETEGDHDYVWTIVKEISKSYFSNMEWCPVAGMYMRDINKISNNVRSLEEKLNLNISYDQIESISEKTLQTAIEMFTYINYCPPQESLLKF